MVEKHTHLQYKCTDNLNTMHFLCTLITLNITKYPVLESVSGVKSNKKWL